MASAQNNRASPGIEVPVVAVALRREEERAKSDLVVRQGVHALRQHGQLGQELRGRRALQNGQRRDRGRTELGSGTFDDGAAPAADVAEIALQIEAQVAPGRLAQLRVAAKLTETGQRQRCQKAADGVVGGRFPAPARPVLVGQRAGGREVAEHPSSNAVRQMGGAIQVDGCSRRDERRSTKQFRQVDLIAAGYQKLSRGESAQGALGGEAPGVGVPAVEEPVQGPA